MAIQEEFWVTRDGDGTEAVFRRSLLLSFTSHSLPSCIRARQLLYIYHASSYTSPLL